MNSRKRIEKSLNHEQPDRAPVDFGASAVTGIHVSALTRLRDAVLGPGRDPVKVIEPFHMAVNRLIHARSGWKTFIHSCGAVGELVPSFIEAGFDILNPVQCSAAGMDPRFLKERFGKDIVFWGGGANTQQTLQFGTPDEVHREVRERIAVFNRDGGFVFNTIHNIQATTPTANMLAMFKAIRESGR